MSSIRQTIVTRVVALLALVGICAAVSCFILVTLEMDSFLDAQLQEIAINLGPADRSGGTPLLKTETEDHLAVRIWDRAGNLVHSSGPAANLPWQAVRGLTNETENGRAWRVYRWSDARQDIQIAQTWSARHEIAMNAAAGAAIPLLLAIPLAWFLIKRAIDGTLLGLQRLSSDISRRSIDAHEPVRPAGVPDEIVPLIGAIDQLVERYQQALEAQRRFVADAAHELRTPLAALQIQAANLFAGDLDDARRESFIELDAGVRRASYLASQLLDMARVEGAAPRIRQTIDVVALVTSVLSEFLPLAEAKDIDLGIDTSKAVTVDNDPNAVRQLVRILLDNAIRYTGSGGSVEIRIGLIDEHPALAIADTGPGIASSAMPLIYDRFFRAAPQEIEGTGLGLAIAKAVSARNGINLSHDNRADGSGTIATLSFSA